MGGSPFYFADADIDGAWRLQQGIFENNSVLVQKKLEDI